MKEMKRITLLFKDLYDGDPWLDVSLIAALRELTAGQASVKVLPYLNTIWEIVNHIVSWRLNVLQRLKGEVIKTPQHNYFIPLQDTSDEAWKQTLHNLEHSQEAWITFLQKFDKKDFRKVYARSNHTYYELLMGIIQHDAYHLGQIIMLIKAVKHSPVK